MVGNFQDLTNRPLRTPTPILYHKEFINSPSGGPPPWTRDHQGHHLHPPPSTPLHFLIDLSLPSVTLHLQPKYTPLPTSCRIVGRVKRPFAYRRLPHSRGSDPPKFNPSSNHRHMFSRPQSLPTPCDPFKELTTHGLKEVNILLLSLPWTRFPKHSSL